MRFQSNRPLLSSCVLYLRWRLSIESRSPKRCCTSTQHTTHTHTIFLFAHNMHYVRTRSLCYNRKKTLNDLNVDWEYIFKKMINYNNISISIHSHRQREGGNGGSMNKIEFK